MERPVPFVPITTTFVDFQPCSGLLYRIETRFLDDASSPPAELARHVERWVDTPTTSGAGVNSL
jgi:hypothetical protein